MKYFKLLFLGVVISAVAIACGNNAHDHDSSNGESTEMREGHDHDGGAMHENGDVDASHEADADAAQEAQGDGPEYTSAYVCPMHCEGSGSDKPGKCPKCGMDYVANTDHMKDGHQH